MMTFLRLCSLQFDGNISGRREELVDSLNDIKERLDRLKELSEAHE